MTPPAHALRDAHPRTRPVPPRPRRKSGPAAAAPRARIHGRGAAMLDRLLRGRGWVMLIGALLAGIVFLNVSVLELNRGIAATTAQSAKLEAQNSVMRTRLADVGSPEAIQRAAEGLGFVLPQPGDIGYLRVRPGDAAAAARRLSSSDASPTLAASGGTSGLSSPATSVSAAAAPTVSSAAPAAGPASAAAAPATAGPATAIPAAAGAATGGR